MLEHTNPEHHMRSMIGYHLAWENSLIGMAMVQGRKQEVVNIGIGVKELITDPPGIPVKDYVESLSHKARLLASYVWDAKLIMSCSLRIKNSASSTRNCRKT